MAALEAAISKKEDMGDRGSRKPFDTISSYLQEDRRENERKEIIAEEEEVAAGSARMDTRLLGVEAVFLLVVEVSL